MSTMKSRGPSSPNLGNFADQLHIDPSLNPAPMLDPRRIAQQSLANRPPGLVPPGLAESLFGHYAEPRSPLKDKLDGIIGEGGLKVPGTGGAVQFTPIIPGLNEPEAPQPKTTPE